ncbi:MAG: tripartite tricarboxylate transporter substrate binding protein [Burkholderiaceae bacterium]|nr:tripartite tricarboxylate transporter substrate binding protein [Burkholderiaceae bacterium]
MWTRRQFALGAAAAALPLAGARAQAQPYPSRPIRLLVPFAPGGAPDVVARALAQQVGQQLGQGIVVENRPGGNSIVATETVAKAAPDGYTLLFATSSHTINPVVYKKLPYDAATAFAPVSLLKRTPGLVLVAGPGTQARDLRGFIEEARGGKLAFGSPGVGNPQQLPGEQLNIMAGTRMLHVPYRGGNLALNAVMSGEIACAFVSMIAARGPIEAGQVRALAVTGSRRLSALPNVPTIAEAGVAGYDMDGGWQGILAPAGTPPEIVQRLSAEIHKAVRAPLVATRIREDDSEPIGNSPQEFDRFLREDVARMKAIVQAVGISIDS